MTKVSTTSRGPQPKNDAVSCAYQHYLAIDRRFFHDTGALKGPGEVNHNQVQQHVESLTNERKLKEALILACASKDLNLIVQVMLLVQPDSKTRSAQANAAGVLATPRGGPTDCCSGSQAGTPRHTPNHGGPADWARTDARTSPPVCVRSLWRALLLQNRCVALPCHQTRQACTSVGGLQRPVSRGAKRLPPAPKRDCSWKI